MSQYRELTIPASAIQKALNATIISENNIDDVVITSIYASDLMSDVLAYGEPEACLLTGLNSIQTTISSYMAEFKAIVFLRGKVPGDDIKKFGEDKGIVIMTTKDEMFDACIKIAKIDGVILPKDEKIQIEKEQNNTSRHQFSIDGKDFASAGMVSTNIKAILKKIGYDPKLIRRVAIATYESEMNVVMHAKKAEVTLIAGNNEIKIIIDDEGKGIPDVNKAMVPGFSTATEDQRAMGFGAGMGLPNIKKNTDRMEVESIVNKGTKISMMYDVK